MKTDMNTAQREGTKPAGARIRLSGAQITVALLERQGVRVVAGIPGGAVLPIYDALHATQGLRHVLARHEQGAGFIAQGIARASGGAGVCIASSGPGATNLITAIADADLDSIPLVCITGQVPKAMIGTDAFQEVATCELAGPITKGCWQPQSARELLRIIPEGFSLALSGRPGPVLVDIPKDVQAEVIEFDAWPEPGRRIAEAPADAALLCEAAALINAARRPILYIGGGVVQSDASALAVELAEKASLPTTQTLMALGAMPATHPLSLGMLGMHAARFTNLALEECDLLIAVGARFDDRATGKLAQFCPGAKVVHIDIDVAELGKLRRPEVAIPADARQALAALLPLVDARPRIDWLSRVADLKRDWPLDMPDADDPLSHYGLIRAVAELVGEDTIVTTDVGQHQMWVAQAYPFMQPRTWLTSGGLGTMGFGVPAALGAALVAHGDGEPAGKRPAVVCFSGDGSLLMNIQELGTAAEEGIDVKIVLMNNNALGLVYQQQSLFYGKRLFASQYRAGPDFIRIAEGFGIRAVDLAQAADPRAALAQALREPGACLIHAPIDADMKVFPMVPPGAANKEMIVS